MDSEALAMVIHGDRAVETQVDVDAGLCIAAAAGARQQMQQAGSDLDRVVIGDRPRLFEAADRLEDLRAWRRSPRGRGIGRRAGETSIVAREKAGQPPLSVGERLRMGEAEFGDEPVLKGAKEALDTAFGLRGLGGDPADAELLERTADLRGIVVTAELLWERHRPGARKCEDTMAIRVHGARDAVAAEQLPEEQQIALGILGEPKEGGDDSARGVVDGGEDDEPRAAGFQPRMVAAVELDEESGLGHSLAPAAMTGRAASAGTPETCTAEQSLKRTSGNRQALARPEHFRQVVIVEPSVGGAGELQHAPMEALGQLTRRGPAAIAMGQRCRAGLPQARQ